MTELEQLQRERDQLRAVLRDATGILCGYCRAGNELRLAATRLVSGSRRDEWSHHGASGQFLGECRAAPLHARLAAARSLLREAERPHGVYIASRSKHGAQWRNLRDDGYPVRASWIDEFGEGETSDWADLWMRCVTEARTCAACILYAPTDDGELKGALVEVGAALGAGRPVYFVGDGEARRYSWLNHPMVTDCDSVEDAMALALVDHAYVAWLESR